MVVFSELSTKRLPQRKIRIEDVSSLVKYANNKKIAYNVLNIPYHYRETVAVFQIRYVYQGFKNKMHCVLPSSIK
jgi:hypothetical protein